MLADLFSSHFNDINERSQFSSVSKFWANILLKETLNALATKSEFLSEQISTEKICWVPWQKQEKKKLFSVQSVIRLDNPRFVSGLVSEPIVEEAFQNNNEI